MKKQWKRILAVLLAAVMLMSVLAGCKSGNGDGGSKSAEKGGDLVYTTPFSEFFNPYKQGTLIGYGWPCYEPLAWYKSATHEFTPMLAESWERDEANNALIIHVRKGVTFSNGDVMDATDVAWTFQARLDYGTQSTIGTPEKVEKVDDYTVKVYYPEFSLNWELWLLTQYIFSYETFVEHGGENGGVDWYMNNMMGTGPYVLQEYTPDVVLKFVRNEKYWGKEVPQPETITFNYSTDATAQLASFLNHESDRFNTSDPVVMQQLKEAGYEGTTGAAVSGMQYYAVPITLDPDAPLSNVDVRKAIYLYGVDWEQMAKTVVGDNAYHTSAIGFHESGYYDESLEKCKVDYDKAKKMLADAGYPNGFDVTIYGIGAMASGVETYLQAELKKIGINAEISDTDFGTVQGNYLSGKEAQTGIAVWVQAINADQQLDRFTKHFNPFGATASGCTNWTDALKEKWTATATAKTEEELEKNLLDYCNQYVNEDCMFWPCYTSTSLVYYQEYYHEKPEAAAVNCGYDPFCISKDAGK